MHTVELLQEALETARRLGYEVRQDWLGGNGGGHCLVRGRKWLLLDVAQTADEQLDVVADALRGENGVPAASTCRRIGRARCRAARHEVANVSASLDTILARRCIRRRPAAPDWRSARRRRRGGGFPCC